MTNSVKKSMKILQSMYMKGLIPYARVSNDFEKTPVFEIFPHPPLPIINNFNEPFKFKSIKINKKTSLLFLSLLKLTSPSKLEHISKRIDFYFDDDLNFIDKDKENQFLKINNYFNSFLEKHNLTEKELLQYANSFYDKKNKDEVFNELKLFKVPNVDFYKEEKKENKKSIYLFFKKHKKQDSSGETTNNFIDKEFKSLSDLIEFLNTKKENEKQLLSEKERTIGRINN